MSEEAYSHMEGVPGKFVVEPRKECHCPTCDYPNVEWMRLLFIDQNREIVVIYCSDLVQPKITEMFKDAGFK